MTLQYNKASLSACTSILVGRKASIDGSTIIGRNEDAKASWPKHFVVHPHEEFTEPQKYVSNENGFTMELPQIRYKYSATPEWTDKEGLFEEDGFNEFGVAMSATESAYSNQAVLGVDPLVKDGIGEEAMVTVVLPYVKTAREGVKRLGEIVEKYGTSETNGVLFSDQKEVWYFEMVLDITGSHKGSQMIHTPWLLINWPFKKLISMIQTISCTSWTFKSSLMITA